MKLPKKCLFLISMLLILLPLTSAQNYYADIKISVDSSGFTSIDGTTNYPELLVKESQIYTSKKDSHWIFNLTLNESSDFLYELKLPLGAEINYVKTSGQFRIQTETGRLTLKGYGENKPLTILVQYEINKLNLPIVRFFIVIVIFIIVFLLYLKLKKKKKRKINPKKQKKEVKKTKQNYDLSSLTVRQKKIMKFLIDKRMPVIMGNIVKELNIPKASVSRNIATLELKGLVEKENIGVSTMIRLKKG
jgi:uncharacterized membrane protein